MEEIPLNTREQILRCPPMERCKLTGMSGRGTERVWQQEAANKPPQYHKSDQEESEMKKIHQKPAKGLTDWNSSENSKK